MPGELDHVVRGSNGTALAELFSIDESVPDEAGAVNPPSLEGTPTPGQSIGRYKLLQEIGEGAFGVVFLAEQQSPVVRQVALKLIKAGMDTRQVIARFEAERQVLAMLDHPNIARVIDAGQTMMGRPYFVMELVQGLAITQFCDERRLTVRHRLKLFVTVCRAVQHAHQQGIIHRDLKPANVLVSPGPDGQGSPKVIDFGMAKALYQPLTDKTLFTQTGGAIGTLDYMSPEHAGHDLMTADTRSDIYSLGALLYELLAGTTPLDVRKLRTAGCEQILRAIREKEPPRPSLRLAAMSESLPSLATARGTESRKLLKLISDDLDWIVMKCLEKDPGRRYQSADALARDIERHLNHQPIEASAPSAAYRLRKFVRRHRLPLSIAATILSLLISATILSSWQAVRLSRARNAEEAQRKQAQAVAALLESVFHGLNPTNAQQGETDLKTRLVIRLDEAAAHLDSGDVGDPLVRARLRNAIGETQLALGEAQKAATLFETALAEQRRHLADDDDAVLITLNNLGAAYRLADRVTEAIERLEGVRDRELRKLGPDDPRTLATLSNLAWAYNRSGQIRRAIPLAEQVRDLQIRKLGPSHPDTLITLRGLAGLYWGIGHKTDAIALLEDVHKRQIANLGANHLDTLATATDLARMYMGVARSPPPVKLLEQVRDQEIERLGIDHPETLRTLQGLAMAYWSDHQIPAAIGLLERVRDQQISKLGIAHRDTLETLHDLAMIYRTTDRMADAIQTLQRVWEQETKKHGQDSTQALAAMNTLARTYRDAGRSAEAIPLFTQIVSGQSLRLGPEHRDTLNTTLELARAHAAAGQTVEAITILEKLRRPVLEKNIGYPADAKAARDLLAQLYLSTGRTADASDLFAQLQSEIEQSIQQTSKSLTLTPADPKLLARRAGLYLRLGRFAEAKTDLRSLLQADETDAATRQYAGAAFAYLGDVSGYEQNLRLMIARFGTLRNPTIVDRVAKTSLLLPDTASVDPKSILARLDHALADLTDANLRLWLSLTRSLALYRTGNFPDCIAAAQKVSDISDHRLRTATAEVVKAMAYERLGQRQQALDSLASAERRMMDDFRPPGGIGGDEESWLTYRVLHRQAQQLIRTNAPSPSPA